MPFSTADEIIGLLFHLVATWSRFGSSCGILSHAVSSPIDISVLIPVFQSRNSICLQHFLFVVV